MHVFTKYEPKACPRCNREHICTGTSHCACFAVEIDDHTLDNIAFHYDDCLCSDCLHILLQPNTINACFPQTVIQPITDKKGFLVD